MRTAIDLWRERADRVLGELTPDGVTPTAVGWFFRNAKYVATDDDRRYIRTLIGRGDVVDNHVIERLLGNHSLDQPVYVLAEDRSGVWVIVEVDESRRTERSTPTVVTYMKLKPRQVHLALKEWPMRPRG